MRCDICGSSDSVFFIKPDGADGELRMCRSCAVARGYAATGEGLGARLDSLVTDLGDGSVPSVCGTCGWTADRLRSSGRLGCPDCAAAFRREILAILKRAGRNGPYEGKAPVPGTHGAGGHPAAASMASALEEAIRTENFEEAAAIRDRLKDTAEGRTP